MKKTRSSHYQNRLVQKTLHPITPRRPLSSAPTARSRSLRPCDKRYQPHQQAKYAVKDKPSFISPLLPRLSHLHQRLSIGSVPAWATRTHGTRSNLTDATIKIDSGRIDDYYGRTHSETCIPHYLTTVSTTEFFHILGYHVKQGGTLTQASFEALNSKFKKVPGSVSMFCPITQRNRFRGTDYEVAIVQKSCIWLRPNGSSNRNTIPEPLRSTSRYTPKNPIIQKPISSSLVKVPGSMSRTGGPQTHLSRKWIDRQQEWVRQFVTEYAHRGFSRFGRSGHSGLAKAINMELKDINESRPLGDKIKISSRSSLYRLIDEFPRLPRSDEPYTSKRLNRSSTQEYSPAKAKLIECDTMCFTIKGAPTVIIYLSVAMHTDSGHVLGWHLSNRPPRYHTIMHVISASLKLAMHFGITSPCYIMGVMPDICRVARILNVIGVKLRVYNMGNVERAFHVEHFFRNVDRTFFNEPGTWSIDNGASTFRDLPTLRASFQKWLDGYHRTPSKFLSPAQIMSHFNT